MNRRAARRQLALEGRLALLAMLLPSLLVGLFWPERPSVPGFGFALFVLGLLALFPSLRGFTAYKHALIATEQAFDTPNEATAWQQLRRVRRRAWVLAALPAWLAALGLLLGLEPVAAVLLTLGSLALGWLYRIPRQLA